MNQSELALKLRQWAAEFSDFAEPVEASDKFWDFLSRRLVDAGEAEDDPDIVRAKIMGKLKKIRIVGYGVQGLNYEHSDGSRGFGIVSKRDILEEDLDKLSAILEALERKR